MTIEERLLRLEARIGVEDLICDLSRAFDAGPSAEKLRPLFTHDACFLIDRYGQFDGADNIACGVADNADRGFGWTLHYLVSPKVILANDAKSAVVDFMLWETATASSGKAYWIAGKYLAHVRLEDGRWRFSPLELCADLISHYPEGWKEKPLALAEA